MILGRVGTLYYFLHFLVILPILGKLERPLPLPESISRAGDPGTRRRTAAGGAPPSRWRRRDARRCVPCSPAAAGRPCSPPLRRWRRTRRAALPHENWSFDGLFGTFDRAAAQRGFQVYKEVCSNCHSMQELHYRDLAGIGLMPAQVKAIAASVTVPTGRTTGSRRSGRPCRRTTSSRPSPTSKAARAANNGALPPDLSLIVKAREGGADYVYGILTGYTTSRRRG